MANRSSTVWRYFNISATDGGKAICKICEQAVSHGGQKKVGLLRNLDLVVTLVNYILATSNL